MTATKTAQDDTSTRIIDLSQNGAEIFENSSMILQKEALEQLHKLIDKQLTKIDNIKENKTCAPLFGTELSYPRIHQAILIEGGRGSGKTTFLLNALSALHTPPNDAAEEHKKISRKLHVLPIIDPTLIETKERIILIIISLIESAINKKSYECTINDDLCEGLKKARENMAGGLNLLDGIGSAQPYGESWEDEAWVMSAGLSKAEKSRFFERKFNAYLEAALNVLGKKAFVLAFDDVDTNFKIGFSVLEAIRKYLSSPQLVLIISGDIDLYGRLVRKNIYEVFGNDVLSHDPDMKSLSEKDKPSEMPKAIRELEEQYILKIVPPQNRIAMLSLAGILQASSQQDSSQQDSSQQDSSQQDSSKKIAITTDGKTTENSIKKWASEQIATLLSLPKDSSQANGFFDVLSQEHLRLVISYLRALNIKDTEQQRFAIFTVFSTRLGLNNIDALELTQSNFYADLKTTFHWLVSQEKPAELSHFRVSNDADKTIILHCLAIAISCHIKTDPINALECLLSLNLPIAMMARGPYTSDAVRKAMFNFIWDEFSWTSTSPNPLDIAGRIGTIARFDSNSESNEETKGKGKGKGSNIGNLSASCFGSVGVKVLDNRKRILEEIYDYSPANINKDINMFDISQAEENKSNGKRKWFATNWARIITGKIADRTDVKSGRYNNRLPSSNLAWFSLNDLIQRCDNETFGSIISLSSYERYNTRGEVCQSISALSIFSLVITLLKEEAFPPLKEFSTDLKENTITSVIPAFDIKKSGNIDTISPTTSEEEEEEEEEYTIKELIAEIKEKIKLIKKGSSLKENDIKEYIEKCDKFYNKLSKEKDNDLSNSAKKEALEIKELFHEINNNNNNNNKLETWPDIEKFLFDSLNTTGENINENIDEKSISEEKWHNYHYKLNEWHDFTQELLNRGEKKTDEKKTNEKKTNEKKIDIDLNIISDIADRIHNQLITLDAEIEKYWKTGHILHRQITNILHAILVVTSKIPGRLESPKTSDDALFNVLSSIKKSQNALHPLAACIISCPLIWLFLDPKTTPTNQPNTLLSDIVSDLLSRSEHIKPNENNNTKEEKDKKETEKDNAETENNKPKYDFPEFTSAQEIPIKIGRKNIKHPDIINIKGFFDVLNVVPRYYKN